MVGFAPSHFPPLPPFRRVFKDVRLPGEIVLDFVRSIPGQIPMDLQHHQRCNALEKRKDKGKVGLFPLFCR